ncbi:glycosyltransferase family 2 protein [Megamonas hypermegale]|uniref:glycosyltransferase family 2 protein n=1 Tax=Megamonas hypermegale TaxID=158847 RepID=UPI0026F1A10F|nr:glycosyltransferase family 2 protein [Megamonas hypermegale]
MVKVSVIIPVYNVESYLERCLNSVLNQTYKDIEIILVNDGSTDSSGEICDKYGNKDKRIKVLHQINKGVSYARLNGFNISQGEYITFVDPDDYLALQMVEKMVYAIENKNVDMVSCQVKEINFKGIKNLMIRPRLGYYNKNDIIHLLKNNAIYDKNSEISGMNVWVWSKLIKRKFLENSLKKALKIVYAEDQIIIVSLLYDINSMYVIPDYLYYYDCCRIGQVTRSYNEMIWKHIEEYFKKILMIDGNKYLIEQIDNKVIALISFFVSIGLKNNNRNVIIKLKKDTNLLKRINFNRLSFKNKIKYVLLKYNMEYIYILLLKIKNRRVYE